MKRKKIWLIGLLAGLVVAVAGAVLFLVPHRPAGREMNLLRLLPSGADLYAVANLELLQANTVVRRLLTQASQIPHEAEYDNFVRATGFRYGRDLKQLALAKSGPGWVGVARVSLDRARIRAYMESQGAATREELGQTVFTFGQSRPFRLVLLDDDLAGFSIGEDIASIRQVLQRHSGELLASAAEEFERTNDLSHIPAGSGVWVVGRMEKLLNADGEPPSIGTYQLGGRFLQGSKTLYLTVENGPAQLRLQVESHCDSAASAERIANSINGILTLLRTFPSANAEAPGESFSSLLAEVSVEHVQESVFLRLVLDERALRFLEPDASPPNPPEAGTP